MKKFVIMALLGVTPLAYGRGKEWHLGTVMVVEYPRISPGYEAILFLDDGTAATIAHTNEFATEPFASCDSPNCLEGSTTLNGMSANCIGKQYCAELQPVRYQLGQTKCQDHVSKCTTVGIKFDRSALWLVPSFESASALTKRLWPASIHWTGNLPKSPEDWQSDFESLDSKAKLEADADRNLAASQAIIAENELKDCLTKLKKGDPASVVYKCGAPDHTNSDLYTDQLVFPNGTLVYIDRATHTVQNVQWTHPD